MVATTTKPTQRVSRPSPYLWVTWLSRLLAGEDSCEWAAWFKGHYKNYEKIRSEYQLSIWQMNHGALLNQLQDQLQSEGKAVFLESQNSFVLRGATASLGGKPDLIALSGNSGTIYDVKTGAPHVSHHIQVMVYQYAIPRALPQYKGITFDGKVVYPDHTVDIPSTAIDEAFIRNLSGLIKRVGSGAPALKVPSSKECQFCDITPADCPERVVQKECREGVTDDF